MHVLENGSIVLYREGDRMINAYGSTMPVEVMEKLVERTTKQGGLIVEFGQPDSEKFTSADNFAERNMIIDVSNRCGVLENLRIEVIEEKHCLIADFKVDEAFVEIEAEYRKNADGRPTLAHRGFCQVWKEEGEVVSVIEIPVTWDLVTAEKLYGPKES